MKGACVNATIIDIHKIWSVVPLNLNYVILLEFGHVIINKTPKWYAYEYVHVLTRFTVTILCTNQIATIIPNVLTAQCNIAMHSRVLNNWKYLVDWFTQKTKRIAYTQTHNTCTKMKSFEDFWEEVVSWGRLKLFPEVLNLVQKKLGTMFVQVLRPDVDELISRGNVVN